MKALNILESFELEINKLDDSLNKPVTDDSIYWINQAVLKFVKERFNGNAPHYTSFEQNEKRTRDLIKLYKTKEYDLSSASPEVHSTFESYDCNNPEDLMYLINEDVLITDTEGKHAYETCVFECTQDNYMYRITNSLTDFHYNHHKARPLRIRYNGGFSLLTDKKYKIKSYIMGYLKIPTEVSTDNPTQECNDFEDNIWLEITKIAAQMYIENQSDQRYQTISNEVNTQE